jgi:ABC-type dipeptide/oligopeptide/nickel transport system ATPase component
VAILSVRNLNVSYRTRSGAVPAVRDVSFAVAEGEFVSLVGGSGSGKSTVASAVTRLTDYLPCEVSGEIRLKDLDVRALGPAELRELRRTEVGCVFQDPSSSLNPVMRVGAQIEEAMAEKTPGGALNLLESVQIREPARVAGSFPHQLSGGMKQRVMIAMALAKRPSLIVADEPTTALDALVQKEILKLLLDLKKSRGVSVLFITHDLNVARAVSDRILVMQGGRVVDAGAAPDFRFTHPYAVKLSGAASAGERPKTPFEV